MASRGFNRKQALEKEVKELYALITFGASGAPTLTTGYGIASIAKNATGDYTITLSNKYVSFKCMSGTFEKSTGEDIRVQLKSEAVATSKTINFFTLAGSSAAHPSSGAKLYLRIDLKNTSVT